MLTLLYFQSDSIQLRRPVCFETEFSRDSRANDFGAFPASQRITAIETPFPAPLFHVLSLTPSLTRFRSSLPRPSKEDLVAKFQADIPKYARTDAEREVDKFLMDGEMLDLYIKYNQRKKEDPDWEPQYAAEDDGPFAVVGRIVGTYAVWIIAGILIKDVVTAYMNKRGVGGETAGGEDALVASALDVLHHVSTTLSA